MGRTSLLALRSLFLFCASTNPQRAASKLPPLPRSSIAAVLAARGALHLTEEQGPQLEKMDEQLEKANASGRSEIHLITHSESTPTPSEVSGGRRPGGAEHEPRG